MIDSPELTPEQHGRKVFEATMASALALISKGMPAAAVVAGLLGCATTVSNAHVGPRETRRLLMVVADCCSDDA